MWIKQISEPGAFSGEAGIFYSGGMKAKEYGTLEDYTNAHK